MSTCTDASNKMGKAVLFLGIETYTWKMLDYDNAFRFMKEHSIDTVMVKVFDGPNEWTSVAFSDIQTLATSHLLKVCPYGYMYGNAKGSSLTMELDLVQKYMKTYGWFCGDIELEWNGQVAWAQELNNRLSTMSEFFYASVLADPSQQNQIDVLKAMQPSVNAWMPQVYDDYLSSVWQAEFVDAGLTCVQPTIDLSQEFGANDFTSIVKYLAPNPYPTVSIWEYQFALANPPILDKVVAQIKGAVPINMTVELTSSGEVANFVQNVDQFEGGESAYECVAFSASLIWHSTAPWIANSYTYEDVDVMADLWYGKETGGGFGSGNTSGMSLGQLQDMLTQIGLQYKDLGVTDSSQHSSDMAAITAALRAGQPVAICGVEANFFDVVLGRVPYGWTPSGNHCIVATGISPSGDFYVRDMANVGNGFNPGSQRVYSNAKLNLVSATAIVPKWLSNEPTVGKVPTGWHDDGTTLTAPNGVPVVFGFRAHILNSNEDWSICVPLAAEVSVPQVELGYTAGAGSHQFFMYKELAYTSARGVYEVSVGREAYLAFQKAGLK